MTYIINTGSEKPRICHGCTELANHINRIYMNGDWITNIIPLNYIRYLYIAYYFDQEYGITQSFETRYLDKMIRYVKDSGGTILGIYQYYPGVHP